jgi:ribosomal protein S18 acetylase RimI-like enzyme
MAIQRLLRASWHSAHDQIIGQAQATRIGRRLFSITNLVIWIAQSMLPTHPLKMLVATRHDALVGLASAQLDLEVTEIVLYMLYVHPDCKARRIGSTLLQGVIAYYCDAKAIRLEVLKGNIAAIEWYKAKGFAIYGETKNATGTKNVAAWYMEKQIDPSKAQC